MCLPCRARVPPAAIDGGAYGVNDLFRAVIAYYRLGYNLPQDAIYPSLALRLAFRPVISHTHAARHERSGAL